MKPFHKQDTSNTQLKTLLDQLLVLHRNIIDLAETKLDAIPYKWPAQNRLLSATNLSMYLALRHHDIRPLQDKLTQAGLSSLGRCESNILNNIERVIDILLLATSSEAYDCLENKYQTNDFSGSKILSDRNDTLFGKSQSGHYTRIMTTLPPEAANDYELIKGLINSGTSSARINCAHDIVSDWEHMIAFINKARKETGKKCNVFMDLAGMKIRTGKVGTKKSGNTKIRLYEGETFELNCKAKSSVPESINPITNEQTPAIISCSSSAFLDAIKIGDSVWIDDGKLGSTIENISGKVVTLRVTHAGPKGVRIKADQGINFPETQLNLPILTKKDLRDLDFVCENADIVGLSFVQSAADLEVLISELAKRGSSMPIVAKIETRQAIENLPEILFKGLSYSGEFAIMIARGDLAVELGSVRMAEMQEEILWLCEAAHIPVIWATQVLESLAKKGIISRPEITDAAMSVRAECVMLNKGKYINNAVEILRDILDRMHAHQHKKVSRLRALHW